MSRVLPLVKLVNTLLDQHHQQDMVYLLPVHLLQVGLLFSVEEIILILILMDVSQEVVADPKSRSSPESRSSERVESRSSDRVDDRDPKASPPVSH